MNFHAYKVLKPMQVTSGCIAPWFEQPGLATQIVINGSVEEAIREGFLEKYESTTHLGRSWMWEAKMWEMIREKAEKEKLRASQGDTCEWLPTACRSIARETICTTGLPKSQIDLQTFRAKAIKSGLFGEVEIKSES
ncbi:hypothetical protein E4U47_003821 [Claviceps purpurea]|nr:hypothetical protein E4U47_003821 [Claviceps purpurea]